MTSAEAGNETSFDDAVGGLTALDPEQVRLLLGEVVRALVEDLHPDGIESDDVTQLVGGCLRWAAWSAEVDPSALVTVVAGALGVHPDEPHAPVETTPVVRHASLLVAYLLHQRGRALEPYLQAAFGEIARAQTVEMP